MENPLRLRRELLRSGSSALCDMCTTHKPDSPSVPPKVSAFNTQSYYCQSGAEQDAQVAKEGYSGRGKAE